MNEAADNLRAPLQTAQHAAHHRLQLVLGTAHRPPDTRLHVRPRQLVRIELRRIGRQEQELDALGAGRANRFPPPEACSTAI